MKQFPILMVFSLWRLIAPGQPHPPIALTFGNAETQGIAYQKLDSIYKSALHTDTALAVFRTSNETSNFIKAYTLLLKDLGKYLKQKGFQWDCPTICANRVYFNKDGTIAYFLYQFLETEDPDKPITTEKAFLFEKLLNSFIQSYRLAMIAPVKFAQCSPVRYVNQ